MFFSEEDAKAAEAFLGAVFLLCLMLALSNALP